MEAENFNVSLSLKETVQKLDHGIVKGSITGERIDCHKIRVDESKHIVVLVYEKYYYRAGNRLTLTITVDNTNGVTHVHSIGGGGGQSIFRFDWGASQTFTSCPMEILKEYII